MAFSSDSEPLSSTLVYLCLSVRMGAKGEADLRAVRQQFAELTRTLAKVDPGRSKEPLLPRIVEALDPFMNEELRHRVRGECNHAMHTR